VQRTARLAARERPVGFGGPGAGAGGVDGADGVQRRVMAFNPGEVEVDQPGRRETARTDPAG
jgi:hypothetical protein